MSSPASSRLFANTTSPPVIKAQSAAVVDRVTGDVLYSKNEKTKVPPASLTKVMTALIALGHIHNLNHYARVPQEALGQRGTRLGLVLGDRINVRNLLRCSLIMSATDCTVTLAHYVAGSEKAFVTLMNAKAIQLGMGDTHFVNSTGDNAPGHYSSALDLALLGRKAMQNSRFRSLVDTSQTQISWPPHKSVTARSRNWLVRNYPWANGIKTGNFRESGFCMLASGIFNSRSLIVVTLHEASVVSEKADVLALFSYGSQAVAPS